MSQSMSHMDIVSEIGTLQSDLTDKFRRIQELSSDLYRRVRRAPADDNTAIYVRYANTWMQFSRMADQGVRRSVRVSKILSGLAPATPTEAASKPDPKVMEEALSPMEALMEQYSEEAPLPYRGKAEVAET